MRHSACPNGCAAYIALTHTDIRLEDSGEAPRARVRPLRRQKSSRTIKVLLQITYSHQLHGRNGRPADEQGRLWPVSDSGTLAVSGSSGYRAMLGTPNTLAALQPKAGRSTRQHAWTWPLAFEDISIQ